MGYGLLLATFSNVQAEPVDQQDYLDSTQYRTESKQHVWPDGARYEGEWANDQPHGYGTLTYANGSRYWGRFQHGRRQGQGVMKYANGDEYEGQWHQDQPQGEGTRRYASGSVYQGEFQHGVPHGQGKQTYLDGTWYQGTWRDGKPHGYGTLTFISGGTYEGAFADGKPHGKGRYFYPNGDVYSGQWNAGNQDGKGRIDYSTGGYYEGEFVEGMRHGQGVLVSSMGQRYRGTFQHNQAHGEGICSNAGTETPCRYRRDQKVALTTVAKASVKPATNSKPQHSSPPGNRPSAATDARTAAPPSGSKPASVPKKATAPARTATLALASVTPAAGGPAAEKPKAQPANTKPAIKPVARPFVPAAKATGDTTEVAATTGETEAAVGPGSGPEKIRYQQPAMSIPDAADQTRGRQFARQLQQEKEKLRHLTVADLRTDRSDIYFNENWEDKDLMAIPEQAWWQKRSSLFSDTMQLISVHGDTEIRMEIADYKGPGSYPLARARINSGDLQADRMESGEVIIESDDGEWVSGSFHFRVSSDQGQALAFDHGAFRLSSRDKLPRLPR